MVEGSSEALHVGKVWKQCGRPEPPGFGSLRRRGGAHGVQPPGPRRCRQIHTTRDHVVNITRSARADQQAGLRSRFAEVPVDDCAQSFPATTCLDMVQVRDPAHLIPSRGGAHELESTTTDCIDG